MAAAFFRGRSYINCLHRELCRVVWRSQALLFSSKPPDRKLPRLTHISKKDNQKVKPQPAVDVTQLLEQLFSQTRPGTAPPGAGKVTKASTFSSTNFSTSDVPRLSKTNPAASVFPAVSASTSTVSTAAAPSPQPTPASSSQQLPPGRIQDFTAEAVSATSASPASAADASAQATETKVETAAETRNVEKESISVVEAAAESTHPPGGALETQASVAEGPVEPLRDVTVDPAAADLQTNISDSGQVDILSTVKPSVETSADTSVPLQEPSESGASVAMTSHHITLTGTTVESPAEVRLPPVEPGDSVEETVEAPVERAQATSAELEVEPSLETSAESMTLPLESQEAAAVERTVETKEGSSSENVAVKEEESEAERMTLESVTLHSVESLVDPVETDELLQTRISLDEKVEQWLRELSVGSEREAAAKAENSGGEDEGELVSEVVSRWSSLSDDLQELEGETAALTTELVCRVPAAHPESDDAVKTCSAPDRTACAQVEEEELEDGAALTLESITLSEVEAEVETLETEALQETSDALQKEADAKEEKMEVKMVTGDDVYRDTEEADMLPLDSISETADVVEAEMPSVMEAMFGSEQRLSETIGQEQESMAPAEVDAPLETLENEAEAVAGETRTEVEEGAASEEIAEGVDAESLSPAEDLQNDAQVEELLFPVPVQTAGQEALANQEAAGAKVSDELDPVQRLFLEKIQEYNDLRRTSGRPVESESGYERHLSEETAKLQRLYGGGAEDLSSFPRFTFTEPELDRDPK